MRDRAALVTGASRGIGRAVAIELARRGARVGINYRAGADEAKQTLALVEEAGGEGVCVQADVAVTADVDRCFADVEDAFGRVGILVNNAGVRADALAMRMSDDAWDSVIQTNLRGTFVCSRRALRSMIRERWGRIVNVASIAGLRGSPGQVNYAAAKAGVLALTRSLAREIGSTGITVNAIAPGLIATDLTGDLSDDQRDKLLALVPQGRAGGPEEVAALVGWLCSDDAAYVTGSTFTVDGGMTA